MPSRSTRRIVALCAIAGLFAVLSAMFCPIHWAGMLAAAARVCGFAARPPRHVGMQVALARAAAAAWRRPPAGPMTLRAKPAHDTAYDRRTAHTTRLTRFVSPAHRRSRLSSRMAITLSS